MKLKSILSLLALAVATTAAAKDYKFETVSGDMMSGQHQTRQ